MGFEVLQSLLDVRLTVKRVLHAVLHHLGVATPQDLK
jgi:hypothetical protein